MRRIASPFDLVSKSAFCRGWLQTFCVLLIPISILQAEPLETQSNPVSNEAIQVVNGNANRSNWSKIPAYEEDGIDGATPNNYFAVQVANDANQIFFRFLMEESDEFGFRHNVYLDADQDRTTGFIGTGAGFLALGAEYLIQGGSIFRFNGGQQTSWGWDWIEDISWDATNHKDIALAVRRQALKNSPAFDFFMNAANFDLGKEEDFYPDMSSQPAGDYFTYQIGTIAAVTIDELSAAIRAGSTEKRYDLNNDRNVDLLDHRYWVEVLNRTYFGDANLDGQFDSSDFVRVFQAGQYEDSITINSLWATGDWNGDAEFTSSDFVIAFQGGGFEQGPRPAVKSVPEPSGSLWLLGVLALAIRRRRTSE